MSESVNALFTADVFQEVSSQGTAELVASYSTEDWVWGDHSGVPRPNQAGLAAALLDLYEQSYIETWNTIVSDLALVPANTQSEVETVLARLSAPTSPLRGMLETVDAHTFLVDPVTDNADPGFLRSALDRARQVAGYEGDAAAGQAITDHFQPIHELVADGLGHVDDILDQLGAIHQQMTRIGPDTGRIPPGDPAYPVVVEQIRVLVDSLRLTSEGLPPALGAAVAEAGDRAVAVAASGVGSVARQLYRREVLPLCQAATGRYPFTAGATAEVTLDEFGQLFGNGGLYDRFFAQQLESFVDRSRGAWRWRPGSGGGGGETLLRQFEQAQRIRTVFFATGATPRVPFTLQFGELDMPAREFTLEVDGQSLQYVRGSPRRPSPMMWPGPEPGRVAYSFEQTQYDQSDGDWAWFRRLEGPFAQRESDVATLLTFRAGPRQATVRAGVVGTRNLFTGLDVVRQFRCTS